MGSILGFTEEDIVDQEKQPSYARKLVPWLNWDEWVVVKDSLFSNSPDSVASALRRISAWRSRGCLPVAIEVTASIIEIQQRDPHYRVDQSNEASLSEEMLSMLYCMAIMRLVNGVVEKTRKKELISIAEAADAVGIPRMLIDIRHEGSHRELPALQVVRNASIKALDWLKSYYWEPQYKSIPFQGAGNTELRREIKSKLRDLALCLKESRSPQSSGSFRKGKRVKHAELLCGHNKLLRLMAAKGQASRSGGSKKQTKNILKYLVPLYSSFSSEIVSAVLEFLLNSLPSSEFMDHEEGGSVGPSIHSVLADWKVIIVRLSNKEPELLLNLLKTVLDLIETPETKISEEDSRAKFRQIERLSSLFAWLVGLLSEVPSAESKVPKRVLLELLRKCLQISAPGNKLLMNSALHLTHLMNDSILIEKVRKLSYLGLSNLDDIDGQSSLLMTSNDLVLEEDLIHQAAKSLDLLKEQMIKKKTPMSMDCGIVKSNRWTLAKSWNPCPIGMLPRAAGLSGCLPVLGCIDNHDKDNVSERKEPSKLNLKEPSNLNRHSAKRDATLDLVLLDNSTVKKMKETLGNSGLKNQVFPLEGQKGCLMVGGVWKIVGEEELLDIQSSVRILV